MQAIRLMKCFPRNDGLNLYHEQNMAGSVITGRPYLRTRDWYEYSQRRYLGFSIEHGVF